MYATTVIIQKKNLTKENLFKYVLSEFENRTYINVISSLINRTNRDTIPTIQRYKPDHTVVQFP